ncbi:MAG TPA: RagB/SusD family nutrient uptake outer membrane protein [Chitinophagaceae bacterium]|nr:RagB/SusD family nutrient uptake outer membrane protein [Chitinophagaceae bacterium]
MKNNLYKVGLTLSFVAILFGACVKKLDVLPTNDITADVVYSSVDGYKKAFAKVYGAFALGGNNGANGGGDIQGIDGGFSDFFRLYWNAQELPTDEAVVSWGDAGLPDFHKMNWSANNQFIKALYYRSFYQITVANDFIRQASDANLAKRGITGADVDNIKRFKAEARFLRAYQYSVLMDLFGSPAFITDSIAMGSELPKQISRGDLFAFVEKELKEIEPLLAAPKANEYGRADQAAAWALLARNYLNAKVYTGADKNTDAITYANKVIAVTGYSLLPDYTKLMRADNHLNNPEFILTINYDGKFTTNWGGTTFLTHAAVGGNMKASDFGIDGGWGGIRTTKGLVNTFTYDLNLPAVTSTLGTASKYGLVGSAVNNWGATPDVPFYPTATAGVFVAYVKFLSGDWKIRVNNDWSENYGDNGANLSLEANGDNMKTDAGFYKVVLTVKPGALSYAVSNPDQRAQFFTGNNGVEINDIGDFKDGYGITKFKNIKSDGSNGSDATQVDIDMPLFRLAEMYLIYAEAVKRGGAGGSDATAVSYINKLRERAIGNKSGNVTTYTLDMILDERARELYWEGFRRTDLIRFDDKFTTSTYVWPWKGDVKAGKGVESWRKVYPIPTDDLTANPNLKQNPNY